MRKRRGGISGFAGAIQKCVLDNLCSSNGNGVALSLVVLFVLAIIPSGVGVELEADFSGSADFVVSAFIAGGYDHFLGVELLEFFDEFFDCHSFGVVRN
jgi:hypothetical protein